MARIGEEPVDRRLLDHPAGIHHDDALASLGDDAIACVISMIAMPKRDSSR